MSVMDVIQGPHVTPIPDAQEQRILARGAPCLVCGEWIEAEEAHVYRVHISNPPREAEYALHETCFERVKHASIQSPA